MGNTPPIPPPDDGGPSRQAGSASHGAPAVVDYGPIVLEGDATLEITGRYLVAGRIEIRDHARLLIHNADFEHASATGAPAELIAGEYGQVLIVDSTITAREGADWRFVGRASLLTVGGWTDPAICLMHEDRGDIIKAGR